LLVEAASSSDKLVYCCQTARGYIQNECILFAR
jgi:hypothetical protein